MGGGVELCVAAHALACQLPLSLQLPLTLLLHPLAVRNPALLLLHSLVALVMGLITGLVFLDSDFTNVGACWRGARQSVFQLVGCIQSERAMLPACHSR